MTLAELIQSDPATAASEDPHAIAAILNAPTLPGSVPIGAINALADEIGLTPKLRLLDRKTDEALAAIFSAPNVDTVRTLIFAALGLFDAKYDAVDFADEVKAARFAQVAGGLHSFGVIESDADRDRFLSIGQSIVSAAEKHVGHLVTTQEVGLAMADPRRVI